VSKELYILGYTSEKWEEFKKNKHYYSFVIQLKKNINLNIKYHKMKSIKIDNNLSMDNLKIDSSLDRFLTMEIPFIQEKIKSLEYALEHTNLLEVLGEK
jgi:hypothetical protein